MFSPLIADAALANVTSVTAHKSLVVGILLTLNVQPAKAVHVIEKEVLILPPDEIVISLSPDSLSV